LLPAKQLGKLVERLRAEQPGLEFGPDSGWEFAKDFWTDLCLFPGKERCKVRSLFLDKQPAK
jgi:hypothetical protein